MSVAEPWSLDHTSTTAPTWLWRITPITPISGPGQAIPRASITWSVATSVTAIPPHSDEDQLAVGGEHEGRDALDVVHQRVQVAPVQAEQVHRQRARMHAHLPGCLAWSSTVLQCCPPPEASSRRTAAAPSGPASGASPWSLVRLPARNASRAQYCSRMSTLRPSAAAPAVSSAAALSLSSVPD